MTFIFSVSGALRLAGSKLNELIRKCRAEGESDALLLNWIILCHALRPVKGISVILNQCDDTEWSDFGEKLQSDGGGSTPTKCGIIKT